MFLFHDINFETLNGRMFVNDELTTTWKKGIFLEGVRNTTKILTKCSILMGGGGVHFLINIPI